MPSSELPQTLPPDLLVNSGATLLWIFFTFGFVITLGFAFGLLYHWVRYGFMYPLAWIAIPIYSVGVLVLLGAMITGISSL